MPETLGLIPGRLLVPAILSQLCKHACLDVTSRFHIHRKERPKREGLTPMAESVAVGFLEKLKRPAQLDY